MTSQMEFYAKLTGLAGMVSNFNLSKETIALYDQHLAPIGYSRICKALDQIVLERNSRDPFPSIKEIRMIIDPELDPDQEAMIVASRIAGAVARFGPYQIEQARENIGPVGWKIVQCEGGWENVCQALTFENQSTLKAQWRNLAKTYINRSETFSQERVALPQSGGTSKGLQSFGSIFISLPGNQNNNQQMKQE